MNKLISALDKVEIEVDKYKQEISKKYPSLSDINLTKMAWNRYEQESMKRRHPWYLRHSHITGFLIGTPLGLIVAMVILTLIK